MSPSPVSDILSETSHRPWPLPRRPWAMRMGWRDVLFAHWAFDPDIIRRLVPDSLEIDVFDDGLAYLGVVPFAMRNVRPRFAPGMPGHTNFLETNVRTYVRHRDKPGVYFFSLDCESTIAVETARATFHLPYFHATMSLARENSQIRYRTRRTDQRPPFLPADANHEHDHGPAELELTYEPAGPGYPSSPGELDHWLTERYCLYSVHPRHPERVSVGEIHHPPWQLQPARAEFKTNTITQPLGIDLGAHAQAACGFAPNEPPILHYAPAIDVLAWRLARV